MDQVSFASRTAALVLFVTLCLLLVVALASRPPAHAQGTCADGVCDPAPSRTYPHSNAPLDALLVKPSGSGTLCTQAQPCALPVALAQAAPGATLYLGGGTYTGGGGAVVTVTHSLTLYGGWDGTTRTPPVRDPTLYPTALDGEDQRRGVYVGIHGAATLDGLTITHGRSNRSGGGIAADLASTTIRNCRLVENSAPGDGGAIFVNGGSTQILGNRVISNTAMWAGGLRIINDSDATVVGNEIRSNTARIWAGGVDVACCGRTTPLIAGNLIVDNDGGAAGGGGARRRNSRAPGQQHPGR